MRRSARVLLLLFIATGGVPQSLQAQVTYGTILGTVTDASGGVVAQANVAVVNIGTNVRKKVQTGREGDYTVGSLFPGEYQVAVEAVGFETFIATHLTLLVDQKLRVDAVLRPGAVTSKVEVTTVAQLVATDSSTIGEVVENKQMQDLPTVSRNFVELAALSPGVAAEPPPPSGATTGYMGPMIAGQIYTTALSGGSLWVGGGRGDTVAYSIDGLENNDVGFQTTAATPPIDAIQEFKIMTKDYTAEFGGSQAQINIAIKSGTNRFHGDGYDFFRNDVLDARSFFDVPNPTTGRQKPQLRYNQFGGSFGGPIKHNKWFFFTNYEGTRDHVFALGRASVPSAAEIGGNFSELFPKPIYDPTTGQPFSGNIIPTNRFNDKTQKWLSFPFSLPPNANLPGGINLVEYLESPDTINIGTVRVDGQLSDRNSIFIRAIVQDEFLYAPGALPLSGDATVQNARSAALGYTHLFSPRLANEFRLGYLRPLSTQTQITGGQAYASQLFNGLDPSALFWGTPSANISPYVTFGSYSPSPLVYLSNNWSARDLLSSTQGKHTIKTGFDIRKMIYNPTNSNGARGIFGFTGLFTSGPLNPAGNGMADFLLGDYQTVQEQVGQKTQWLWSTDMNGFIQDDWKATRRLTLNLGLRYEYRQPQVEQLNRTGNMDFTYPGGRICTPNVAVASQLKDPLLGDNCPRGLYYSDFRNYAPRVGFAYRPSSSNNTVVRAGFGIFYDSVSQNEAGLSFGTPPLEHEL